MAIRVVSDTTSDVYGQQADDLGMTIVPATVVFGREEFRDREQLSADEFYEKLTTDGNHPTTAAPSIGQFVEAYESIGDDADGIVSVHPSSKLSATYNSAVQAASQAKVSCPIRVIDSQQVSMGLGLAALAAARAARDGGDLDSVAAVAESVASRATVVALLDTIEYLKRGGRISGARAFMGAVLRVKPLIVVADGEVQPLAKARTFAKGLARLEQEARSAAPLAEVSVMYGLEEDKARALADSLSDALPQGGQPMLTQIGSSIGVHIGPNSVGLTFVRAE